MIITWLIFICIFNNVINDCGSSRWFCLMSWWFTHWLLFVIYCNHLWFFYWFLVVVNCLLHIWWWWTSLIWDLTIISSVLRIIRMIKFESVCIIHNLFIFKISFKVINCFVIKYFTLIPYILCFYLFFMYLKIAWIIIIIISLFFRVIISFFNVFKCIT